MGCSSDLLGNALGVQKLDVLLHSFTIFEAKEEGFYVKASHLNLQIELHRIPLSKASYLHLKRSLLIKQLNGVNLTSRGNSLTYLGFENKCREISPIDYIVLCS